MSEQKWLRPVPSTLILAGTLLLTMAGDARAGHEERLNFREFRDQNPGVERQTAREMFRELRDTRGGGVSNAGRADINAAVQAALRSTIDTARLNSTRTPALAPDLNGNAAVAQVRGRSNQKYSDGKTVRLSSGLNLDLTSAARNISLGKNLFDNQQSVTISTGEGTKTYSAGSVVSAAEYIAVKQVLAGGDQKLTIDKNGRAVGGSVDLDSITGTHDSLRAATYVNAKDVTTIGDFSKRSEFKLLGDLNNFGTLIAESGSSNARAGAIRADDINNYNGATISSNLNLTLDAAGNLNNLGTINSAGSLTLSAGSSLSNSGTVSASQDLRVNAAEVRNKGEFSSTTGSVSFNTVQDVALEINNRGGTISATNGAINLRDADFTGVSNSFLTGGANLYSQELNMNSGQGTAWVAAEKLTGSINQTGSAAHVTASTDALNLGTICLTGDPTFFNTAGSINITGSITVAENLVIAASGNITSVNNSIITAANNSQGFDVTLIAGADFTNTGGTNKDTLNSTTIMSGAGGIRLTGKSSNTGGAISLNPNTQIKTRPLTLSGAQNGGNVQMFAFGGNGDLNGIPAGLIDFDMGSIETGGNGAGINGNVLAVTGTKTASLGIGILAGTINTMGGTGGGGQVQMVTANPTVSSKGSTVTYGPNGAKTSSASLVPADKLNKKISISILGTITGPSNINLLAGKDIIVNNVISGFQTANLTAGADLESRTVGKVSATNLINLTAGGNIGPGVLPFLINTPHVEFDTKGFATIKSETVGAFLVGGNATKGAINIVANSAVLSGNSITAKDISIQSSTFGTFQTLAGSSSVALVASGATNFASSMFGQLNTPKLGIQTGGSIGTIIAPFELSSGTTYVEAVSSGGGNIVMTGSSSKELEFHGVSANNIIVSNSGSLLVSGNTSASGAFTASTANGTLTVDNDVTSGGAQLFNGAGSKGKFVVANNTALQSGSTITITVGAATAATMPTPKNVSVEGNVVLTGSGIKAKKPESTISGAAGKQIKINNGNSSGSISFGGDVLIITN